MSVVQLSGAVVGAFDLGDETPDGLISRDHNPVLGPPKVTCRVGVLAESYSAFGHDRRDVSGVRNPGSPQPLSVRTSGAICLPSTGLGTLGTGQSVEPRLFWAAHCSFRTTLSAWHLLS